MKRSIRLYVGCIMVLVSFLFAVILNIPTMGEKTVSFSSAYGEDKVTLKGTYWETEGASYAALICPGYSCDRQKWRPMADLLVKDGLTVMSFDYSGQGASTGSIGFDNAKTDKIPVQIDDAIEKLHELSGIPYDHIILVGHSMGGRSILRLLYDYHVEDAETLVTEKDIQQVILLSPEVNYQFNAQASLFAGTSDDAEEPWHSFDAACIKDTNVYLFGSTSDDIVADEDILAIYRHLGADNVPESGTWNNVQTNAFGGKLTVGIVSGVLHSYQMYSPQFARMVNDAVEDITGKPSVYPAAEFMLVYGAWFLGLIGIGLVLSSMTSRKEWKAEDQVPVLKDPKQFLIRKALWWLPGTVVAFIVCCICVVMPFGSPVMNTPYMCFIAGYGFVMLFAYRKGAFKGVEGKLPGMTLKVSHASKDLWTCIGVCALACFFVWYVLRSSMYRLIPFNARLFWVCFAAILMTVGYYVSGVENDMLSQAKVSGKVMFLYNLIQYVPLLLLVLFYAVLKSYSGMIGQIQNMLLMYIFCVPLGNLIKIKTGNRLIGALVTGFLFQTLMITSAALISMF